MVEAAGIEPASVGGRCCLASCISRPRYAIGGIEGGIRTSLPPLAAMPPSRSEACEILVQWMSCAHWGVLD